MSQLWTIGEVARRTGIAPSALRYYEAMGLIPPAQRVHTHRRYDTRIFEQLAFVQLAQRAGFTVAEIGNLVQNSAATQAPSEQWSRMATQKLPHIAALIARATDMKRLLEAGMACPCTNLATCPLLQETVSAYRDTAAS